MNHTDLAFADVHVASLRPQWTHVCVPSKAVTTICLGRPLIFAGDRRSDTARMLGEAAWIIPFPKDGRYDGAVIDGVLSEICSSERREAKCADARRLAVKLRGGKERALSDAVELVGDTAVNNGFAKLAAQAI
jgi:hypothetical protein